MALSLDRPWYSSLHTVERAILNRFRKMFRCNRLCPSQIRNGPRHFANTVMGPRAQPVVPHGLLQQTLPGAIEGTEPADLAHAHGRVMWHRHAGKARPLAGASHIHTRADRRRRLRWR